MTVDVARQLKVHKLRLVINKVLSKLDVPTLQQKVETTYNIPVAGVFPLSEDMIELGSSGLFSLKYPNHPLTQVLRQVATTIVAGTSP